jgi:hypothetical protein
MSDDDTQFERPDISITRVGWVESFLAKYVYARPLFANDGGCAHPEVDLLERCRLCNITMNEGAYTFRESQFHESQIAKAKAQESQIAKAKAQKGTNGK